jgi:hypothetical protein
LIYSSIVDIPITYSFVTSKPLGQLQRRDDEQEHAGAGASEMKMVDMEGGTSKMQQQ